MVVARSVILVVVATKFMAALGILMYSMHEKYLNSPNTLIQKTKYSRRMGGVFSPERKRGTSFVAENFTKGDMSRPYNTAVGHFPKKKIFKKPKMGHVRAV